MDIRDLVRYNHIVRRLYFETLAKLPWSKVVRPRGASFDCMRNIFLHLTIVENRWINYVIPDRFKDGVDPPFDEFKDFNELKGFMFRVDEMTEAYLKKLTSQELSRKIIIPWGDTPDKKLDIETVLVHMVVEDLIHYGELSDLLWQIDAEPPYLGFWRYMYNINGRDKTSR